MKVIKKEVIGIQPVFSTNVNPTGNYISEGNIINKNCVCDTNYRGEIHINLINTSANEVVVAPGEKIAQAVLLPIGYHEPIEVDDIANHAPPTDRGEGGFGSSGIK